MTFKSQHGVIAYHSIAIVGYFQEPASARFNINGDARCSGINRIFDKLFGHRSWALYYFARSDLVGNAFGEDVDFAHEIGGGGRD